MCLLLYDMAAWLMLVGLLGHLKLCSLVSDKLSGAHYTQHTAHCTLYTAHCTPHTEHCTAHCKLLDAHWTEKRAGSPADNAQGIECSMQCMVHAVWGTVQFTVCSAQCAMQSAWCMVNCVIFSVQCTICNTQCTVKNEQCMADGLFKIHGIQCIVHSAWCIVYKAQGPL